MTPPIRMVSVPSEPLWMMHVLGPDDIYPAPDHATAVEWCASLNKRVGSEHGVLCVGVPAIWTGTAEEHAEGLPEAIKGWTTPAAPVREEGGAGDYTMALAERQPFEAHPALTAHIERMAVSHSVGSLIEWDAFLRDLNAALATREEAPAEAGE